MSIRASAEELEIEDSALAALGEVGSRTSLRYAVQVGRFLLSTDMHKPHCFSLSKVL